MPILTLQGERLSCLFKYYLMSTGFEQTWCLLFLWENLPAQCRCSERRSQKGAQGQREGSQPDGPKHSPSLLSKSDNLSGLCVAASWIETRIFSWGKWGEKIIHQLWLLRPWIGRSLTRTVKFCLHKLGLQRKKRAWILKDSLSLTS